MNNQMKQPGNILIVDDDEDILVAGKLLLKRHFESVAVTNSPEQLPKLMANNGFHAILLDMNFGPGESSGQQGYLWLDRILQLDPNAVVLMITAHGGVDDAVEAMKKGATDFITKPWQNEKLVASVSAAVKLGQSKHETQRLKRTNQALVEASNYEASTPIMGDSEAMQQVHRIIAKAAPTEANVLILGENGTGKELVARALHRQSSRSDQVFMSVDLGAVAENLFESELFGHRKGAFTDAREDRVGKLQAANGGTLFLDEIGNLPLHLQVKMLTVLEQRKVTPLGANESIDIDVRIIAATNANKSLLMDESEFRQDLLFRLNTVEIQLPPLRARKQDILPIANHYLSYFCRKYQKQPKPISPEAEKSMLGFSWPGNVRALKHAVERAVILAEQASYQALDFGIDSGSAAAANSTNIAESAFQAQANFNLEQVEKNVIQQALQNYHYNISHAAKALGLTRGALYRRMEKYDL